jgi:transposase-like protein
MEQTILDELTTKQLLPKKMGRPAVPQGDPEELEKAIQFFQERNISYLRVSRALDVSTELARRWWRTKKITAEKLERLTELVKQIEAWERQKDRKLGS